MKSVQEERRTDHLGREFKSLSDMCSAYGVNYNTYRTRLMSGHGKEEALTKPVETKHIHSIFDGAVDHLGNTYASVSEMCRAYNISPEVYRQRIKRGEDMKTALTENLDYRNRHPASMCTDHLGNMFKSKLEMCRHYGISAATYRYRLKSGKSKEEALTGKLSSTRNESERTDHSGNVYKTITEMAEAYGVKYQTYIDRIRRGYTKEEALNPESRLIPNRTDADGIVYESVDAMCKAHGIKKDNYYKLRSKGLSKADALARGKKRK